MDSIATTNLIIGNLEVFGLAVVSILGSVLVLSVGYLVFKFGWSATKNSLESGSNTKGNGYEFMDDMGTYWKSKKERDESNRLISESGF